ncbi:MAG: hypothetical protein CL780_01520, partial [Chloroflexi bacterium]|nr:hypothetical protein [Chloroflexota bacterium]
FSKNSKKRGVLLQKKIYEIIPSEFFEEIPKAHKTFTRWIDEDETNNYIYSFSDVDYKLLSYLQKLQLIQNAVFKNFPEKQKLTYLFVVNAEKIFYQMNDPYGSKVDLFAQWVLIYEYYSRSRIGINTDDLDDLIIYSPWEDNAVLYEFALLRKLCSYPNISILINNIDDINSDFLSKEFKDHHNSLVASTYAWLRIPVNFMYWNNESSKPQVIPRSNIDSDQAKFNKFPTWRQLVQISISGQLDLMKNFKTQSNEPSIYLEQKIYDHPDNIQSEPRRKRTQKEFEEIMRKTGTFRKISRG